MAIKKAAEQDLHPVRAAYATLPVAIINIPYINRKVKEKT